MTDSATLILALYIFIGLVLIFAQLKLFSIDASLKKILRKLEQKAADKEIAP